MSLAHTGLGSGNLSSMESEGMESKYHYRVRVCVYIMIYYVYIYIYIRRNICESRPKVPCIDL